MLLAVTAAGAAAPGYVALDRFRLLAPTLRDRPWPLAVLALALAAAGAVVALRGAVARGRAVALSCATVGLLSVVSLFGAASARYALPPSDLPTGRALPDVSLPDDANRPVALASLRGSPTVLVFYRGAF